MGMLEQHIERLNAENAALRAQVERLQAERGQVVGWCNPGQLFELQQGRAPHAYFYPAREVGASVPLYTSPPAVAQAGGADEDEPVATVGTTAIVDAWNALPNELRLNPHLARLFDAVKTCRDVDTPAAEVPGAGQSFEDWWRRYGQFLRAGGGDYEKTFAYHSWSAALAAQPARVAMTDEQIRSMCKQSWVFETVKQWVRIIEAHHGITPGDGRVDK